ncbi:MAG: TolC family outer membrane protein [Rhodobacteraceae bacterium]|nr:TolC family outer membrane protein [Paracoccaceae bacterium]
MIGRVKHGLTALAVTLLIASAPTFTRAETLTDALISAYRHSGLLEQNQALLRATDEDVAVAVAALRPSINYALSRNWSDTQPIPGNSASSSATLSASLLVFDFGRSKLGIEVARENVLATRDMLTGVEQNVLLGAVSAFLNVRSAAETAALQVNNVRLIGEELRAARDRFEVGEITQTDVSFAEAQLAAARAGEAAATGSLIIAREGYKAATGHYPGTLSAPPTPPVTVSTLDEARALGRRRHPDMLAGQRNVTIAEMNVELALLAMKPSLTASGSSTFTRSTSMGDTTTNQLGLSLQGSIYQGGRLSALYRKAQAMRDAARAGLHVTKHSVDQNIGVAWAQMAIAGASFEAAQRQIRANTVALRGAREELSLGARTTLDVLNAEQSLLDARAGAITAQSDQYLAAYQLLSAMGLLTAEHLRLGIATYDPEAYFNAVSSAPVHEVSPQGERLDAVLEALMHD